MPTALLLTAASAVAAVDVATVAQAAGGVPAVATRAGALIAGDLPSAAFDLVVVLPAGRDGHAPATLRAAAAALAPGGKVEVRSASDVAQGDLRKALVLAGLVDVTLVAGGGATAVKPAHAAGAAVALPRKAGAPDPAAAAAWAAAAAAADGDLIDDDALLTEAERAAKPAAPTGGCAPTKKACKDCSCGRAEAEAAGAKPKLTQAMLDDPQTNCGSCSLGDAFRCGGCPYRGLPAFEPGKKITLPADFLLADT